MAVTLLLGELRETIVIYTQKEKRPMSDRLNKLIKIVNSSKNKSNVIRAAKILLENYGEEMPMNELAKLIPLIRILDFRKDPNFRNLINKALGNRFDEDTYQGLLELIDSEDTLKRAIGVDHIHNFKRIEIMPHLLKILELESKNENWMIRERAAWSMIGIENTRIHKELTAVENREKEFNFLFVIEAVRKDCEEYFMNKKTSADTPDAL